MKIAFLGKGGSGKTTLSAAFATYMHEQEKNVLLVDADVNVHVNRIIGIEESDLQPISRNMNGIVSYVKGERVDLGNAPFISATPPSKGSRFITLEKEDELLKGSTVSNKEGLRLMTIGTYEGEDIGFTCYHGKTDAFIIFLNHLLDTTSDYLVVDSVTGTDNLGNPLIYSYDLNVIVVEPTKKSIQVYKDFIQGIERFDYPINIVVIGNKVETKEDEEFIKQHIKGEHLLGFVSKSDEMKSFDQGSKDDFKKFVSANSEIFNKILKELDSKQRDWDLYLKNIRANFSQMAQEYYNSYYHVDLESRVDNTFSFKDVV
ncbi:MAG: AAA family ATPase [Candidatus Dojkabacteria bacterium]